MVTITMVHAPKRCPKCERTEEICRQVAAEFPGQVRVELLGAQQASARYGVVLTPTVIVDDMLVSSGAIPRKAKIREAVAQRIEACERTASRCCCFGTLRKAKMWKKARSWQRSSQPRRSSS